MESVTTINNYFTSNPEIMNKISIVNILLLIIAFLYFFLFELKLQQTIGKMVLKLYVVNQDKKKKELKIWQIALRNLFVLINIILIVDLIYFTMKGKRLSDEIAKTKVIEVISA
jgi:uncharacterized RDD family membrane protein YckC